MHEGTSGQEVPILALRPSCQDFENTGFTEELQQEYFRI